MALFGLGTVLRTLFFGSLRRDGHGSFDRFGASITTAATRGTRRGRGASRAAIARRRRRRRQLWSSTIPLIKAIFRQEYRKQILINFRRDTGRLYRSPRVRAKLAGSAIIVTPTFPLAMKRGGENYAFILNSYRPFMDEAEVLALARVQALDFGGEIPEIIINR